MKSCEKEGGPGAGRGASPLPPTYMYVELHSCVHVVSALGIQVIMYVLAAASFRTPVS